MTPEQKEICLQLGNVRYLPASFDKRFGNNLHTKATLNEDLSEKQNEWMFRLLYKYRNPMCTRKR